jgi:hypothetical protein
MIEQKILIVVEGIANAIFLRDYLSHLYKLYQDFIQAKLTLDEKKNKTCVIDIFEKPHIRIFFTGGCARLLDLKTQLVEEFDSK